MEGEEEHSDEEGSFSNTTIPRKIAIVAAGGLVNIIFALIVYIILMWVMTKDFGRAISLTGKFAFSIVESLKILFSGNMTVDSLMGPVGISEVVAQTSNLVEFIYILALISMSLGVTNLLPFPPLDGGKILLLIIEAIRKKPLKEDTEIKIQMIGFVLLISLSIYVTYNDITKII